MKKIIYALACCIFLLTSHTGNSQVITGAEYFVNVDPGVGSGIPIRVIPGNSVYASFSIVAAALSPGFNLLFVRVIDQNNSWSIAEQHAFYVDNNLHALLPGIPAAEYFFDTDPGNGNGTALSIQGGDSIKTVFNISSASLAAGFHQLFIRIKDQYGQWSIAEQRTFNLDSNLHYILQPLVAAEYFINPDNGTGNGTPFAVIKADSLQSGFDVTALNLPLGNYIISLRLLDSSGKWSIAESRRFTVCTTYGPHADFEFSTKNLTVEFTNNSSYATSYHWIFGDGDTSNLADPVHLYKPGSYKACLISRNSCNTSGDTLCKSIASNAALPVVLANIQVHCAGSKVVLSWQTVSETNTSSFEVQTSINGSGNWNTIGTLQAARYSTAVNNYQFTDDHAGTALYRLHMTDGDGRSSYSGVFTGNCQIQGISTRVYPVPASDKINILIPSTGEDRAVVLLTDVSGKLVKQVTGSLQTGTNMLTMDVSGVSAGAYVLKVQGTKFLHMQKIMIMH